MAAAAVRINNATREDEWGGSFVDVLPRNIYALAVLLIFLRVIQLLTPHPRPHPHPHPHPNPHPHPHPNPHPDH